MMVSFSEEGRSSSCSGGFRHGAGGLLRRIDQRHPGPHHLRDHLFQERVVGAAEHQGVDPFLLEPLEIHPCGKPRHLVVHPSLFGKRDEERTGAGHHLDLRVHPLDRLGVGAAPDGRRPCRSPRPCRSSSRGRAPGARLDDPDDRDGEVFLEGIEGNTAEAVLQATTRSLMSRLNEKGGDLPGIAGHRLRRLRAVGDPRRIAQIDGVLLGKCPYHLFQDGEAANSGIEYADGFPGQIICSPYTFTCRNRKKLLYCQNYYTTFMSLVMSRHLHPWLHCPLAAVML